MTAKAMNVPGSISAEHIFCSLQKAKATLRAMLCLGALTLTASCSENASDMEVPEQTLPCRVDRVYPTPERPLLGMRWIPAGSAAMGTHPVYPEEQSQKISKTEGFWMSPYETTTEQFSRFIRATGYVTTAERQLDPSANPMSDENLLRPGGAVFVAPVETGQSPASWWRFIAGANWANPKGDSSDAPSDDLRLFPVTQISIEDAKAYADWLGHQIPTEDEWEYAAIGGAVDSRYPWGNEPNVDDRPQANHWQGLFPTQNSGLDGFHGVAPTGCFPPNGYGLFDMVGNVWELVDTSYSPVRDRPASNRLATIKGGSYLCADNFCGRFRPSARQPVERELTTNHIGFRTVVRPK
ncbi:MAG: SUMF1/EgtB/PvdO family nonheme iron enzyme [Pseudomonadota bacterium]